MAGRKPVPAPTLPPMTVGKCWAEALKWAVGVPAAVLGGLAIIGGALWLTGGLEMFWQTISDLGTALF